MHPAYWLGWVAVIGAVPCAGVILMSTGMSLAPRSVLPLVSCLAVLGAAHLRYSFFAPEARLALATGAIAMLVSSGILAGIISHIGLRLRRPLIDDVLLAGDRAMHIDASRVVLEVLSYPHALRLLDLAYSSALPLCFMVVLLLAAGNRTDRTWEAAASFSVCIIVASLVGALYPAIGNFAHTGLGTTSPAGLPANAGVFHLPIFNALYRGSDPIFDFAALNGVVTFPSFHMAMALICAWAWRGNGMLSGATGVWGAVIAISTIPIGGHYIIDLIAGLALWAAVVTTICLLSSSQSRDRPRGHRVLTPTYAGFRRFGLWKRP